MEPPVSFDADAVRDEKGKVLRAIQPIEPEEVLTHVVRGQYDAGTVAGVDIGGYRDEEDVPENSRTETFVAMELAVDNWRWADVPFYLRTGKCLPERLTEVAIQFKRAPLELFRHTAVDHLPPNMLVIHLQPNEGITLSFQAKVPGPVMRMEQVGMNFDYEEHFGLVPSTGYETLVYDCMCGDATLFQRSDNVEAGWRAVTPILDVWRALPPRDFPNYRAGTWGPPDAATLLSRHGRKWRIDR
jgi:glucose-6-phosphate 1-dehydrogenase